MATQRFALLCLAALGSTSSALRKGVEKAASEPEIVMASQSNMEAPADPPPSTSRKPQFTPDQADWKHLNSMPIGQGGTTAHDPDSFGYVKRDAWKAWNGKVIDPTRMSKDAFYQALCPSENLVVGLRELFYKRRPFANNKFPTKAEVDDWNRVVVNHFRAVVGRNTSEWWVKPDKCLFLQTQWADERKNTNKWDRKYPASSGVGKGPMWGPCGNNSRAHCGHNFVPNPQDQRPYLPRGQNSCDAASKAEGILGARAHHVWASKLSFALCRTIKQEGPCGGHVGPFFRRTHFGFSFYLDRPDLQHSWIAFRGNWKGELKDTFRHC